MVYVLGKGSFHNFKTDNESIMHTPMEMFKVKSGYRYRFRLISNGILYCPTQFSIDHHNLTVIATDGSPVEPVEVESVVMYNGERYDIVIHTDQLIGNYWIRARGDADCKVKTASQLAILRYDGTNDTIPAESSDYFHGYRSGKVCLLLY